LSGKIRATHPESDSIAHRRVPPRGQRKKREKITIDRRLHTLA